VAGPAFIDREVFPRYLAKTYQDIPTIYGDLSRLVVGMVANTDPAELQEMYAGLGWGGSANVRALHDAARDWMRKHRPKGLRAIPDA
jgi:hypothetical protein